MWQFYDGSVTWKILIDSWNIWKFSGMRKANAWNTHKGIQLFELFTTFLKKSWIQTLNFMQILWKWSDSKHQSWNDLEYETHQKFVWKSWIEKFHVVQNQSELWNHQNLWSLENVSIFTLFKNRFHNQQKVLQFHQNSSTRTKLLWQL